MVIGILESGRPPRELGAKWGTYDDMVRAMLGEGRPFQSFDVTRGVLPLSVGECEAYVVTGSPAGVYDDLPWIAPLLEFLRQARGQSKLVGVCFGHQAMAQAFGGEVVKSPKGWGLGLHRYAIQDRAGWMDHAKDFAVPAFHQDQVVRAPDGARVLAASEFTPFAALGYGEDAVSLQGHPEFSTEFSTALIEAKRDLYGAAAGPALASLHGAGDSARVGVWIKRFLDGAQEPHGAV